MNLHMKMLGAVAVATTALAAVQPAFAESKPMFARGPFGVHEDAAKASALPSYKYTWTYQGKTYNATIAGADPATGTSTTVPVYLIPVQLKYGTTVENPNKKVSGTTVTASTLASPIFTSGTDFKQSGVDLGSTQYIDAYARGNFYGTVQNNLGYHILLGTPTVEKLVKITVPTNQGSVGTEFGVKVILADINWFDSAVVQAQIAKLKIPSNALAIFETTQTYLTSGGCCIGGYHSVTNAGGTYSHFTYIQKSGAFSQDVSALSHEIGEWQLDPFTNNTQSPCGGLLENGDPLEGLANYGDYPYVVNGFTYHLQDLVDITYFGAPASTTVNGDTTFQAEKVSVCQHGQ